jgi:beta-lactam-binding protein with PASTA domain
MHKVWDGTEWSSAKALKVWNGTQWKAGLKFKVRTSTSWLPGSVSDKDDSQVIKWSVEGPTPPPPPPPVTHPVPNLNLKTIAEVNALLDPLSFTYSITGYETTSDNTKDDKVVVDSQYPAAGQSLAEGSNVTFKLYNFVQPTTTVPNLNDLLKTAAENAILNANLVVGTPLDTDQTYDTNKIGRVIENSQYPTAGSTVDTGTAVVFDYWVQKPYATVPILVDKNDNQVFTTLNNANLTIGTRTTFATSNSSLDDKVKSQYPASGTQVQQGSSVDYVVYDYTLRVVPNLNGKTQQQAQDAIINAGLYVGTISNQETTVVSDEGKVKSNSQSHPADTEVLAGTSINFTVWVPNTTTTVPTVVDLIGLGNIQNAITAAELNTSLRNVTYTRDSNLFNKCYGQSPQAYSIVAVNSTVYVDLYLQEPTYTVPSIIGLTPSTGAVDSYFTWGSKSLSDTSTESTSNFGKVATQSPMAQTSQYSGPINYGIYVDGRPTVPGVVGQPEAQAKTAINNAGLNWTVVSKAQTFNGQATAGTVYSQNYSQGTRLASGTYVTIEVWAAYVPQLVTRTGSVTIGWSGDIAMLWQASYRDTLANISGLTDGGRRTTTAPFYFGYLDTTNGKQHHAFHFDWTTFDNKCKQITGGASYSITGATLRYWLNNSIGTTAAKSLRIGSYPSSVSSSPTTMRESDINTRGLVLSASTRGQYAYATLNATLMSDIFTYPNYPTVVYAPNTSVDNYGSNDSDVQYTVNITWQELQ